MGRDCTTTDGRSQRDAAADCRTLRDRGCDSLRAAAVNQSSSRIRKTVPSVRVTTQHRHLRGNPSNIAGNRGACGGAGRDVVELVIGGRDCNRRAAKGERLTELRTELDHHTDPEEGDT